MTGSTSPPLVGLSIPEHEPTIGIYSVCSHFIVQSGHLARALKPLAAIKEAVEAISVQYDLLRHHLVNYNL